MKDITIKDVVEIADGSVIGTDHVHINKPNQDAYHIAWNQDFVVGVVCDGCGDPTSPYSEIGARLVSRMVASDAAWSCKQLGFDLRNLQKNVERHLRNLVNELGYYDSGDGHYWGTSTILKNYFLCTILGFAITPDTTYFFGVGDGTLIVNGENIPLGPFPNNTPPYLAYSLMDSSLLKSDPGCLDFQIHKQISTGLLDSFLIGSDGAQEIERRQADLLPNGREYLGGLAQFWSDDRYYKNPQAVNRKLLVANTQKQHINWEARGIEIAQGLLHDDTTLLAGRTKR
jgi:hypothetical protein